MTGTLASMTHREAHELVERHGGTATAHVSRQTTLLVVGEEGWPLEPDGRASLKLEQVLEWRQQGLDIRVLSETEWLHLLGLDERRQEVHRLYTPAVLSQLLDVPVGTIRRWERMGLIRPVRKVCRLPYFDFQEVTGARRLIELTAAGVSRREIEAGLNRLESLLPGIDRPLAQLEILARDARLFYRDDAGLIEPTSGQRFFDFEPPEERGRVVRADTEDIETDSTGAARPGSLALVDDFRGTDVRVRWSADDWVRDGCRLLEENDPCAAIEAFRLALMQRPGDPETHFFLAEALYRLGSVDGALERYYAAVENDHDYLEAWVQLGCLHGERGELERSLEAFRVALNVHSDYPDAHWHAADVLHRLGRTADAVTHWQSYLEHDSRGPWADSARQRLEEATLP